MHEHYRSVYNGCLQLCAGADDLSEWNADGLLRFSDTDRVSLRGYISVEEKRRDDFRRDKSELRADDRFGFVHM